MNASSSSFQIGDYVFVDFRVLGVDHFIFLAHPEAGLDKDRYEASLIEYQGGQWRLLARWPWQGVALVVARQQPLGVGVLGRDGQIGTWDAGKAGQSHLDARGHLGPMRGIDMLDGQVFAFGMQRHVFTVGPNGQWQPINDGMNTPPMSGGKVEQVRGEMVERLRGAGGIGASLKF